MGNAVNILFATPNFRELQQTLGSVSQSLEKLSRAGQGASERYARAAAKSHADTAKSADKSARDAAKSQEKLARDAVKAVERAERDKVRAVDRAEKDSLRIRNAVNRQALTDWKRDLAEQASAHQKSVREMESRARALGRGAGATVNRALGSAGRIAGTVLTLGGGFTIADSLGKGIQQEATAGTIYRGAAKKGDFTNSKQLESLAETTALATGGTTQEMLEGLDQFVRKTGDLGAAKKNFEDLAKLAAASSASFADMGSTAAEVQNILAEFGQADEMERVMRAIAGQGRAGAIDIKDLGQYGGRLAAGAAQFTGDVAGNIESFGAIAQLAKKLGGATGPAEATESVARLGSDLTNHEAGFKALGVDVFSDKSRTKLRGAEDVITDIVGKTKGDLSKLEPLFGEMSFRAVRGAQVAYTRAGGGSAGEAAIREQFANLRSTTMTKDEVNEGVRGRLAENQAQLNIALIELTRTVNGQLMPVLPKFIEKITQLVPALESFLGFFTNNSAWLTIPTVLGAALVAEVGKAGIGAGVSAAVQSVAARALPGVAGLPAVAGGAVGTGATAAGTGILAAGGTALAGIGAAIGIGGAAVYGVGKVASMRGEGRLHDILGAREGSAEERAAKLASLQGLVSRVDAQSAAATKLKSGAHTDSITPAEAKALGDTEAAAASKNMDQVVKSLERLRGSLDEKAGQIANLDISPPRGLNPSDPSHPSRGALAP